jgi:hypothetical protein
VNDTPAGAGTNEATLTMVADPTAVVKFDPATYSVREGDGNVIIKVRKYGTGAATMDYFTSGANEEHDFRCRGHPERRAGNAGRACHC